jgi:hypothetical protein
MERIFALLVITWPTPTRCKIQVNDRSRAKAHDCELLRYIFHVLKHVPDRLLFHQHLASATMAPTYPSWRFTSGTWPNHHPVDHANSPRAEPRNDYWIFFDYTRSQAASTDTADLFAQTVSTTPGGMTQLSSTMKNAATSLTNTYYTTSLPRSIGIPRSLPSAR